MPLMAQVIVYGIVILGCLLTALATDHKALVIRKMIAARKLRLSQLNSDRNTDSSSETVKLGESLSRLEKELVAAERPLLSSSSSGKSGSLAGKLRASLPLIAGITVGVILGAIVFAFLPILFLQAVFTLATFAGSAGILLELVRNEKTALALSAIPAGLYALTQIFDAVSLFDTVFWLFDIVVLVSLIGVALIFGKEISFEVVLVILAILTAWDIIAVLGTNIMGTAVFRLAHSAFSLLVPAGLVTSGGALVYSMLGGGDLFFSFLLVTVFARKLKAIPTVLIGLIVASLTGLTIAMYALNLGMAPALPAILPAGLLATAYYHKRLK